MFEHRDAFDTRGPTHCARAVAAGPGADPLALLPGAAGRLHEPGVPAGGSRMRRTRPGDDRPGQRPVVDREAGAGRSSWPRPASKTARCRSRSTGSSSPRWSRPPAVVVEQGASAVDINMGCPVRKVVKTGGGSALMCQTDRAVDLVAAVVNAVSVPVTVKMRLGWDDESLTAPALARAFEQVGVAAVIVHGRTRQQGFTGQGQPRGHPGGGRGRRADSDRRQRRHPNDRRRRRDVRGNRLRGHLDRPRGAGQSLHLPPARLLGPDRRTGPRAGVRRTARADAPPLPRAGRAARRALRLLAVPQDPQVVFPFHPDAQAVLPPACSTSRARPSSTKSSRTSRPPARNHRCRVTTSSTCRCPRGRSTSGEEIVSRVLTACRSSFLLLVA